MPGHIVICFSRVQVGRERMEDCTEPFVNYCIILEMCPRNPPPKNNIYLLHSVYWSSGRARWILTTSAFAESRLVELDRTHSSQNYCYRSILAKTKWTQFILDQTWFPNYVYPPPGDRWWRLHQGGGYTSCHQQMSEHIVGTPPQKIMWIRHRCGPMGGGTPQP